MNSPNPHLVGNWSVVLEKLIFNFITVFSLFCYQLPLIWKKPCILYLQGWFINIGCNCLGGSGQEYFFLELSMYSLCFTIICPWKGGDPLLELTWIPFTQNDVWQVYLKLANDFKDEYQFLIVVMYLYFSAIIFTLEKGLALHLLKLQFPKPNDGLV